MEENLCLLPGGEGAGEAANSGEFCANCGYHRMHAIRLLNGPPPPGQPTLGAW
jgi:hypothetical protein